MREERGQLAGPLVVFEPLTLWGSVGGDVTVVEGGKFYMRGSIYGNLNVEYGGRAHIFGSIAGSLKVARGAKVIHSGVIVGDATNEGGRLFVESTASIQGKVITLKGETKLEPKTIVPGARRRDERNE
jgi:cytoskeletal protein CcmA (bactofilin family)